jgi:putative ABC transport system ATP-binding protein
MTSSIQQHASHAEIIELARTVCEVNSIAFSANDANQSLADVSQSENVEDRQLLDAVGQRIGIRFREVEGSFRDLILSAIEVSPIIVGRRGPDGLRRRGYFVIKRRKSQSQLVVFVDGEEQTVSHRWLRTNAFRDADGLYSWYVAQPMFADEAASSYNYQTGVQSRPLSPLRRLIAFLKPEARDIRTVFVFSIFVGILSLTTPLAVEALVNTIAFGRYLQPLVVLSFIVFVFLAFRAGLGVLMTIVVEVIQRRLFVRVVDDLALRLTRVPVAKLKKQHGPELVNRFFEIVNIQKITSKLLLDSLMLVLQTAIGLTVLAFYHPFLLGYDIGLILIMTVVLFVIGRGAAKTAVEESGLKYETAAWLQEIVRHPTTFKFNGGLGFAINRADELAGKYIQGRRKHFRILVRQITFSMLMQAVAATALLGLGGYLVIERQMTLGQLVAAELIVTVILGSFAKIGKDLESFYDLLASVDKLGKLLDLPAEAADKLRLAPHDGPTGIKLVELKCAPGTMSLNVDIAPGTTAAIIGRSGSGKTKIIETLAGLHAPVDGYALVNDFRVDLIGAESLQSRIGFINDIEIFEGSVDENLRLGRREIDSASMNDVIEKMGLHKTITGLDDGMKTELSVSGYPLSTGQAIRLVLARALIARPGALLIDGLLDRLSDEDLDDVLTRLNYYAGNTTMVIATGRKAIADWAKLKVDVSM